MVASRTILRVLVVDDDDSFRRTLVEVLERNGFECRGASSAREALLYLADEHFDVGIYDIVMPGMNGGELAAATREMAPDMQLIALSAVACTVEIVDAGFNVAIRKPFDIDRLLRMCRGLGTSKRMKAVTGVVAPESPPSSDEACS